MNVVNPLTCHRCGVPMNFHAEKSDPRDESGHTVLEFHTCPSCGEIAERPSGPGAPRSVQP